MFVCTSGCMSSILKDNAPWAKAPSFDPTRAMLCVSGSCPAATLKTLPSGIQMQQLASGRAADSSSAKREMLDALYKEQQHLDAQQLELNWKRARVFAQYMGPPGKSSKMVLADWVPPLDQHGRPVPSWLKFVPAGSPGTTGLFGTGGAWDPESATPDFDPYCLTRWCSPIKSKPSSILSNNTMCYAHDTCSTCLTGGCAWCQGSEVCGTSCPALWNVNMLTQLSSCPAPATLQQEEQSEDAKELSDLTRMSRQGEVGSELVKNISKEEQKFDSASDQYKFFPLAKKTALGDAGDASAGTVAHLAVRDTGKISMAIALLPFNVQQVKLNAKREMLFFRTETGVQPGLEQSIYDPTVGGGGHWDNWAKPTTTWSLIGRPAPGWLHWGNDNDGGYFNPVGGSEWDPQMLDPVEAKGTYGPATNSYRVQHTHPEDEPSVDAIGSPLEEA